MNDIVIFYDMNDIVTKNKGNKYNSIHQIGVR